MCLPKHTHAHTRAYVPVGHSFLPTPRPDLNHQLGLAKELKFSRRAGSWASGSASEMEYSNMKDIWSLYLIEITEGFSQGFFFLHSFQEVKIATGIT